jgi:hypothetical protein
LRSSSTSSTSLAAYTAPERAQKITKASSAWATAVAEKAFSAKTTPASTNPFLVHCLGLTSRR